MNTLIDDINNLGGDSIDELKEPLSRIATILERHKSKSETKTKTESRTTKTGDKDKDKVKAKAKAEDVFEEASKFVVFDGKSAPKLNEDISDDEDSDDSDDEEEEDEFLNGFEKYMYKNMDDCQERDLISTTLREKTKLAVLMFRHLENKRFTKSKAPEKIKTYCLSTMNQALKSTKMDGSEILDTVFDDERRSEADYRRSLRYLKTCAFLAIKYDTALRRYK